MKNNIIFASVALLLLVGCGKDSSEPNIEDTKATITYKASVNDPLNYLIQVGYTPQGATELIQDTVESPFSYDINAEYGTFLYISVSAIPRIDNFSASTIVHCSMYDNDVLIEKDSDPTFAVVQKIFGLE